MRNEENITKENVTTEETSETKEVKKEKKPGFFSRSKGVLGFIVIVAMMIGLFYQNGTVGHKLDKYLNDAGVSVHEIYDDTKVIEAYKNGTTEGLNDEEKFLVDTLNEVIPEITTEDMTPFEKEKAAYEWVFRLTHLSGDSLNPMNGGNSNTNDYTPYGVIKGHEAICVGNATTFKLMMDAMDIPCMIIHSTESGEHAWDVVQLDDEWYHVDITFDNGSSEPAFNMLNLPDTMKDDGSWPYDHEQIPACKGTKYCYMFMNAKTVKNMYKIPKALADSRDAGEKYSAIIVEDTKDLTTNIAQYIGSSVIMENGDITYTGVYMVEGKMLVLYQLNDYSESDTGVIPDDIMEKLSKEFEKANAGIYGSEGDFSDIAMG